MEKLRKELEELRHVNHLLDLDYKEQQESFQNFWSDVLHSKLQDQAIIAQLKAENETVIVQKERMKKELKEIRSKYHGLELMYEDATFRIQLLSSQVHQISSSNSDQQLHRLEELKKENQHLRKLIIFCSILFVSYVHSNSSMLLDLSRRS